jgi:multiple sugar transport system permease protein/raffinose/stachyose/melibiose transport system permease protein
VDQAFVAPAVALFLLMGAYTIAGGFLLSFAKWNGFTPEWRWVGLGNYADLLHADPSLAADLRRAAGNTAQVMVVTPLLTVAVALPLAVMLNSSSARWAWAACSSPRASSATRARRCRP